MKLQQVNMGKRSGMNCVGGLQVGQHGHRAIRAEYSPLGVVEPSIPIPKVYPRQNKEDHVKCCHGGIGKEEKDGVSNVELVVVVFIEGRVEVGFEVVVCSGAMFELEGLVSGGYAEHDHPQDNGEEHGDDAQGWQDVAGGDAVGETEGEAGDEGCDGHAAEDALVGHFERAGETGGVVGD